MTADRWQHEPEFCAWVLSVKYARLDDKGAFKPNVSDGLLIFMWEAWLAGKAASVPVTEVKPKEPHAKTS